MRAARGRQNRGNRTPDRSAGGRRVDAPPLAVSRPGMMSGARRPSRGRRPSRRRPCAGPPRPPAGAGAQAGSRARRAPRGRGGPLVRRRRRRTLVRCPAAVRLTSWLAHTWLALTAQIRADGVHRRKRRVTPLCYSQSLPGSRRGRPWRRAARPCLFPPRAGQRRWRGFARHLGYGGAPRATAARGVCCRRRRPRLRSWTGLRRCLLRACVLADAAKESTLQTCTDCGLSRPMPSVATLAPATGGSHRSNSSAGRQGKSGFELQTV
jgi:hypothetical protein